MVVSTGGGRVAVRPVSQPAHCPCCADKNPLTWVHQRVIDLLAAGLSTRELADTMRIDFRTVATYAHRIARLLGVANRYEAVAVCLGAGWVTRCRGTDHAAGEAHVVGETVWLFHREFTMLPLIAAGRSFRQISEHETRQGRDVSENRAAKSVWTVVNAFGARTRCHLISMLHDYGYGPRHHRPEPASDA